MTNEEIEDLHRDAARSLCHICGKLMGQPPERCNGHYTGASSDPSLPDSARLDWLLANCKIGYDPWQSYLRDRSEIDVAIEGK